MTAACTLTNGEIEDWTKRREHLFMNEFHFDFFFIVIVSIIY